MQAYEKCKFMCVFVYYSLQKLIYLSQAHFYVLIQLQYFRQNHFVELFDKMPENQ